MRITALFLFIFSFISLNTGVSAVDCSAVPEAYRAKCETALKTKNACEGKTGDEYKKCVTGNIDFGAVNDCEKESDAKKKAACKYRTQVQAACAGKAGAELKACIKAEVKKTAGGH